MSNFYSVIHTRNNEVDSMFFFHEKEHAEKKYNGIVKEIKKHWGYEDYNEEELDDNWSQGENYFEFVSYDECGDDDFLDRVEIKDCNFED